MKSKKCGEMRYGNCHVANRSIQWSKKWVITKIMSETRDSKFIIIIIIINAIRRGMAQHDGLKALSSVWKKK